MVVDFKVDNVCRELGFEAEPKLATRFSTFCSNLMLALRQAAARSLQLPM